MAESQGFRNAAFVCGMESEARCLRAAGITGPIALSAARSARATEVVQGLLSGGAESLISIGLAGGLDPRLGPGSVILADHVLPWRRPLPKEPRRGFGNMFYLRGPAAEENDGAEPATPDGQIETDGALGAQLRGVLDDKITRGCIVGVDQAVTAPGGKLALYSKTGALACDMESHAVAEAAQAAGIPFAALRVVADPSNRTIPQAALSGVTADGKVSLGRVAFGAALRPWEIMELLLLALDARIAFGALRRVARRSAPLFGAVG